MSALISVLREAAAQARRCEAGAVIIMPRKRQPYLSVVSDRTVTEKPYNAKFAHRVVVDPYDGKPITVTASLRDDPIGRLHARRQIAEHHYRAALELQGLFEAAEIGGGVKAMDFTREPVDGGRHIREPYSDRNRRAADDIDAVRKALGREDFGLLQLILAERMFLGDIAAHRGRGWGERAAARKFKAALEKLAELLGHAGQAPARRKQYDQFSAMARDAFKEAA
jgi:hypothetical protein